MSVEALTLETCAGQAEGCRILRLNGPLTLQGVFAFQTALRSDPPPSLVLDLTSVPYMDSAGMGAIINYFVSCQRNGRKLVVAGVNARVMELFRLTKVDHLLTIVPTIADAENALA
jgi:anti-sigma B factor antagonist